MVEKIIEGLLPGTRSLRPPLISGILWGLFLWIIVSDYIPLLSRSSWAQQFYTVMGSLGPLVSVGLASILVFVLGASLANVSDFVSNVIGRVTFGAQKSYSWQRHARNSLRDLRSDEVEARAKVQRISEKLQTLREEDPEEKRSIYSGEQSLASAEKDLAQHQKDLAMVRSLRCRKLWIPDSADMREALGNPPATAHEGLERELVLAARGDGRHAMMEEKSVYFSPSELARRTPMMERLVYSEPNLTREFISEIETDPLQVLQSLDEALFLEMDRKRAEREVRLAFSTPLMALMAYGVISWGNVWWWLILLFPLAMIVRYSFEQAQERTHVLRLLRLNSLRTPALRRVYERGRRDVLMAITKREKEKDEPEDTISSVQN